MNHIGSDQSTPKATEVEIPRRLRPTWPRTVLSTILPPLGALLIQLHSSPYVARWSLFYPAVFLSAWLGGFGSGMAATAISTALVWWYFLPPVEQLAKPNPMNWIAAMLFLLMGTLMSVLQGRLRRLNRQAAVALDTSQRVTEQLRRVVDERRIFAALIENSSDFIGIADADGTPLYLNPAGRRMVGLPDSLPVSATQIIEYYPAEQRDFVADVILKEMLAHEHWQGETMLRHWQTNQAIPVSDTHFLVRDPENGRLLGMATITRDISVTRRARDELESANERLARATRELGENQRFLQAILDYSPNAVLVKDMDGRYLLCNHGFERVIGMRGSEVKGKTDFDLFPRPVAERFRNNDRIVREKKAPLITEERPEPHRRGRVFLVNKFPLLQDDGQAFAICAIWSDISGLKRAEAALRQSADDLREAQRVAHVGSWRWDPHSGAARWSEELYRIFGLDPSKPPPRLLSSDSGIFRPESHQKLVAAVDKLFRDGTPYQLDLELVMPDGSTRWVSARGDAVRDAEGNLVEISGVAQDITQLRELQRLRDEWTSVIAHDLRQPIGVIKMAADFLPILHTGEPSAKEQDFTRRISGAARTLARMVDDLLDLSLLEADRLKLERRWLDPLTVVKESVDRLSQLTGDRRVTLLDGHDGTRVFIDPMRIGQVLGNLLSNAVKYGEPASEIVVCVERQDGDVHISVTNSGKGIAADELPRIFSRFARSKTARGSGIPGLGLGLYISKGVIEAHGGRMWAESIPGQTTTFHMTLPCRSHVHEGTTESADHTTLESTQEDSREPLAAEAR